MWVTARVMMRRSGASQPKHDQAAVARKTSAIRTSRSTRGQSAEADVSLIRARALLQSIDLVDAYHPQTILAYAMNGQHCRGAWCALRLRLERQLGYKQAKYVMHIEVVESYTAIGQGRCGYWRIKATPGTPASESTELPERYVLRDPAARATRPDLKVLRALIDCLTTRTCQTCSSVQRAQDRHRYARAHCNCPARR